MTGRLPNFVSITVPACSDESADIDLLPTEIVASTWRVYAITSHHFGADLSLQRLRNLFWRLWSNPRLVQHMPASTVTQLVRSFGQEQDLSEFPWMPRQAGHPSTQAISASSTGPRPSNLPPEELSPDERPDEDAVTSLSRLKSPRSPQSILKRPEPATASAHQSSLSPEANSGANDKKRTSFVTATTARSRTRPALGRRKSSQANGNQQPDARVSTRTALQPSSGLPMRPAAERPADFVLPSSWQSEESDHGQVSEALGTSSGPVPLAIDENFRGKFIESQKRAASSSNLATPMRMQKSGSVVRFADDVKGVGKGKARETEPEPRRTSTDSQVFEDDDDDNDEEEEDDGLPRTKSQLSLMIESQRRISGTHELAADIPRSAGDRDNSKPAESRRNDREEELLLMGRKDGVTKAGGVAPERKLRPSETRYRSPSPPPLYG